jgi:regulator of sigma E protease
MTDFLISLIAFIVVLSLLITVHEFGHYWVALKCGVKVLRFSVGFGAPLFKRVAGPDKTEYVIAAIPLGGYVKMLDEREGPVDAHELHRAFNRAPVHKRFAIVAAGPLFNFLFAIFAYWLMFNVGLPGLKPYVESVDENSVAARAGVRMGDEIMSVGGRDTPTWQAARQELLTLGLQQNTAELEVRAPNASFPRRVQLDFTDVKRDPQDVQIIEHLGLRPIQLVMPAVIGSVLQDGTAEAAGFKSGDRVLSSAGSVFKDWIQWVEFVRARPDQTVNVRIERGGVTQEIELHIAHAEEEGKVIGRIGAGPGPAPEVPEDWKATQRYGVFAAIIPALQKTWDMSSLTLVMMGKMLIGQVSVENLSGPITIAKYAGYTANIGMSAFLSFLAIVSVSLGVLNLLPVPMLDGGHLMYYLIEIVKRSPLSDGTQMHLQRVGLALLLLLMSLALYNDVARLLR